MLTRVPLYSFFFNVSALFQLVSWKHLDYWDYLWILWLIYGPIWWIEFMIYQIADNQIALISKIIESNVFSCRSVLLVYVCWTLHRPECLTGQTWSDFVTTHRIKEKPGLYNNNSKYCNVASHLLVCAFI